MDWIAWVSILAGIISGALSGWGAAWIGRPAAQVAAEEARQRNEARRKVIADGRELLVDVARGKVSDMTLTAASEMATDARYLALRPYIPESKRLVEEVPARTILVPGETQRGMANCADL